MLATAMRRRPVSPRSPCHRSTTRRWANRRPVERNAVHSRCAALEPALPWRVACRVLVTLTSPSSSRPGSIPSTQVFWALSKLRYSPTPCELEGLLGATARVLPSATPVLLATILWGLADMQVRALCTAALCTDPTTQPVQLAPIARARTWTCSVV